jgi:hypothetical protein
MVTGLSTRFRPATNQSILLITIRQLITSANRMARFYPAFTCFQNLRADRCLISQKQCLYLVVRVSKPVESRPPVGPVMSCSYHAAQRQGLGKAQFISTRLFPLLSKNTAQEKGALEYTLAASNPGLAESVGTDYRQEGSEMVVTKLLVVKVATSPPAIGFSAPQHPSLKLLLPFIGVESTLHGVVSTPTCAPLVWNRGRVLLPLVLWAQYRWCYNTNGVFAHANRSATTRTATTLVDVNFQNEVKCHFRRLR